MDSFIDTPREASLTPEASNDTIENVLNEKYFLELMRDVVEENKVEKMAIFLKVPQYILSPLLKNYGHDVPLLATKVLMAWRQNLQCETLPEAIEELASALTRSDLARKSTLLHNLQRSKTCMSVGRVHITLRPDEESIKSRIAEDIVERDGVTQLYKYSTKKCTRRTCGWGICYSTLVLLVLATVAVIPSMKYTPKTNNSVYPTSVKKNDTVELSFEMSTSWFETLSLSIDKSCTAAAFTHQGKCRDLYRSARVCFNQSEYSGTRTNYLLPGSYFNFTVSPNYQSLTDVWITWNPDLLAENNYTQFSCDSPPPQTVCLHPETQRTVATNIIYHIPKAAYYAHYISPPIPNYPDSLDLVRHMCTYNVTQLNKMVSAVTQKPIKSEPVDVDILYKPYHFRDTCTILHVQYDKFECPGFTGGKLSVVTRRRQDIMLFPALLAGIAISALILVALSHIVCIVRQRRRNETIYQRLANSTEV